ncbi:uncharacterized protein LOC142620098 [Castanea sativa]|uniref:uncharacterized protein LOC142620098 n=1 Tax=Castanea sativa TaxID=21020 RepID=UPI003F6502FE
MFESVSSVRSTPVGSLNPISSPWPFTKWGLDIIGPFPRATGNRRFFLVAVDYFTKWAEAKALANIRDIDVKKFVWRNMVTKFGVPKSLVSDNGLQFDCKAFRKFYNNLSIKNRFFPVENEELMVKQLDSLEECWESAIIKLVEYQQKLAPRFNKDVRSREFSVRDLVLRKVGDYTGSQHQKVGSRSGRSLQGYCYYQGWSLLLERYG